MTANKQGVSATNWRWIPARTVHFKVDEVMEAILSESCGTAILVRYRPLRGESTPNAHY